MMKLLMVLIFSIVSLTLSGCFTLVFPIKHDCQKLDPHTLLMAGKVDEDMLKCAEENIDGNIDKIIVSSFGGSTKVGRKIGDLIAKKPRTVVVRGECLSSCGNYFIPTAKALIIEPEGFIGLHGGIDPMTVARIAEKEKKPYDFMADKFAGELKDENRFAKQYNVPLGWRIYREKDDTPLIASKGLEGTLRPNGSKRKNGVLLVERLMLDTCLPHVEIIEEHIADTVIKPQSEKYKKRLEVLGVVGSGSLKCKPETGQMVLPKK